MLKKLIKKCLRKIYTLAHRAAWKAVTSVYILWLKCFGRMPLPQQEQDDSDKVIYLTFDDGPTKHTRRLLNILDRYHVKSTFFVLTQPQRVFSLLKEIAQRGHTLGNHTANHEYREIYESEEAFFQALHKGEEIIKEHTGLQTKLIRFPGGSSSIRYHSKNPNMDIILAQSVQNLGYQYVDWNVCGEDTQFARTPIAVYREVIRQIRGRTSSLVLLHDTKDYTVDVIEMILIWGLRNGYVFLPMDENSPVVHHRLR